MKALVGAFNQEKTLVGAFSVIVKTDCGTDGALHSTSVETMQTAGLLRADSEVDMASRRSTVSFSCDNNFIFDKLSASGDQSKPGTTTTASTTTSDTNSEAKHNIRIRIETVDQTEEEEGEGEELKMRDDEDVEDDFNFSRLSTARDSLKIKSISRVRFKDTRVI